MKHTKLHNTTKCIVFLIVFIGINACKTTKETVSVPGSLVGISTVDYFDMLIKNNPAYQTLSFKMNVELNSGKKSFSSKATLKIEKNKNIQISVQPFLGVEAFRMQITPDSIVAIDRLNRRYIAEDMQQLKNMNANFDFLTLQALFTNGIFVVNKNGDIAPSDRDDFDIQKTKDEKMTLANKKNKSVNYIFTGNANNRLTSTSINSKSGSFGLDWEYASFDSFDGLLFPKKMDVNVERKDNKANMTFSISKIEKDGKIDFDISIPSKYKRIGMSGLLNLLLPQ